MKIFLFMEIISIFVICNGCSKLQRNSEDNLSSEYSNVVYSEKEIEEDMTEDAELISDRPVFWCDCLSYIENQSTIYSSYITDRYIFKNHYYIDDEGVLWGKGNNAYAQLGFYQDEDINNFGKEYTEYVQIAKDVIHIDASLNGYFVVYLTEDNKLYGMGQNTYGVLRQEYIEDEENRPWINLTDQPVLLMEDVKFASAGLESIAVLTNNDEVYWWGRFQASTGTENSGYMESLEPKLMIKNGRYVVCSGNSAAGIDNENNLWLWGCNVWGQCGKDGEDYVEEPFCACENVEMVWVEYFSNRNGVFERDGDPLPYLKVMEAFYPYTSIIRKQGNKYYACGIECGKNEKTVKFHEGLLFPGIDEIEYTHNYSSEFIEIEIDEIEERLK